MKEFIKLDPKSLPGNVFERIEDDWMLVTTQRGDEMNTMTANWGGMGILWYKPVVFLFIRPQRYTREMLDDSETFTLSFYDRAYRTQLSLCGKESGRDMDKIAACGFTPRDFGGAPGFEEAETVITCRKLFRQHMKDGDFIDGAVLPKIYPKEDFHYFYIAEVTDIFTVKD